MTNANRPMNSLRCFLLSAALSLTFAGAAYSAEARKPAPKQSLDQASEALKSILIDAERKGLVKPKKGSPVNNLETPDRVETLGNHAQTKTPNDVICENLNVLDMTDLKDVQRYEYLDIEDATSSDKVIRKARRYLALGLGVEASKIVDGRDDAEARLIHSAGAAIDGTPNSGLTAYQHCNAIGKLWAAMGPEGSIIEGDDDEEIKSLIDFFDNMPAHLMERLAIQYAIESAEAGYMRPAYKIWNYLENRASLSGLESLISRTGQNDLLFLRARLNEKSNIPVSQEIYNYLSERDTLFALSAIQRISYLKKAQSDAEIKGGAAQGFTDSDLLAIAHQYGANQSGKDAKLLLIKRQISEGFLRTAIDLTKVTFTPDDPQLYEAAKTVAVAIRESLKAVELKLVLETLNIYFHDVEFFELLDSAGELKADVVNAAIEKGFPELAKIVYDRDDPNYQKTLLVAQAHEKIKRGNVPQDLQIPADQKLIMVLIQRALAEGDTQTARKFLSKLKDEKQRKTYEDMIAWIENSWSLIAEQEDADQVLSLLNHPADRVSNIADVNLSSIRSISEDTRKNWTIAQEYVDNG